jgi:hypothetical protein
MSRGAARLVRLVLGRPTGYSGMVRAMRDDSQSRFTNGNAANIADVDEHWRPSWTGLREKPRGMNDETLSAVLLLVLSGAEEHQHASPTSERIVNLLSEMEAHPSGSATENAVRAGLITRLSAALSGLRAELE